MNKDTKNFSPDYLAHLKSDKWKSIRDSFISKVGRRCFRCSFPAKHVHHRHYKTLGDEKHQDLEHLCAYCHTTHHRLKDRGFVYQWDFQSLSRVNSRQLRTLKDYFGTENLKSVWYSGCEKQNLIRRYVGMMLGGVEVPVNGMDFGKLKLSEVALAKRYVEKKPAKKLTKEQRARQAKGKKRRKQAKRQERKDRKRIRQVQAATCNLKATSIPEPYYPFMDY